MRVIKVKSNKNYIFIPEFIWDGVSASLLHQHIISVKNGFIDYIGPASNSNNTTAHAAETVSLPDTTLMPGLVDCHVHLAMNSSDLRKAIEAWETNLQQTLTRAKSYLKDYLRNGVIAVRDGGDKANVGLQTREITRTENIAAPVISATSQAIYKKGMYGSFLGPGINSINDALEQVDYLKTKGVDQIKVIVSGLVSFKNFGSVGPVQFFVDELREIVTKAHSLGLKVMAHASSAQAVETSVLGGVDSIEHGYFLTERQLELMARHQTAWIPTLAPLGNLIKENRIPYPGADLEIIKRSFERQLVMVESAHKMMVALGIGTDAGANQVFHGYSYHDELSYYAETGIDNYTILKMATSVSAKIIGRDKSLGTVTLNKNPFWCCVGGNPLKNLQILKTPKAIILPE